MNKLYCFIVFILIQNITFSQVYSCLGNKDETKTRIDIIKQSSVKILVDYNKSGTGFFVSSDGIVLTNWHVVFNENLKVDSVGRIRNKFSIVDYKNDTIPVFIALNLSNRQIANEAIFWDYCILKSNKPIKTRFLKLGLFSSAYEGAPVYTCGFPLDLNEPFISTGLISSFFKQSARVDTFNFERQVAWLDLTTNKGNSGGALILLGEKPENDIVIGITSFITTPYYNIIEKLNKYATEMQKQTYSRIGGIDFLEYVKLINTAANSNSVGISGCISIDKIGNQLKPYNK